MLTTDNVRTGSYTQPEQESLFSAVKRSLQTGVHPGDALVPVDDFAIYYLLASEIARMAHSDAGPDLWLFVDGRTAHQVDVVDGARAAADRVYVFGSPPESWRAEKNLTLAPARTEGDERDLFLIAVSPTFSLGVVCEPGTNGFMGGWTARRDHVIPMVRTLFNSHGMTLPEAFAFDARQAESLRPNDASMACAIQITALMARQLMLRQRDIAMDKDDLSSVLIILKAVSAKRRAHDILFVFVEQIARVVHMDRCSVVRVWGGDNLGHVLASHEDESVSDLTIDLKKYPEIQRAMQIRQKVVINDTRHDPLTRPFLGDLSQAGISSLVVIPVVLFDQNVGSFLLRAARTRGAFTLREISFCEIVAEAAANALERAHLFESIQKAYERLEHLAVTDGLTGLFNHRYFRERLESEFERAHRYGLPLSVIIMDIDGFKKVNDTFGHLQGDSILRDIAAVTMQAVRKSDIVARYGGEEFVVIMPQTGLEGAKAQAERVCRQVSEMVHDGLPPGRRVTVSVGVAVFVADAIMDCEALIRVADGALYAAKASGKNRVVVGQP